MVAALRRVGFDKVFDTQFAADLTIWKKDMNLLTESKIMSPAMVTSCSPGWIKFIEHFFPNL
jgi:iron only hydrogenase large subunit-like protein